MPTLVDVVVVSYNSRETLRACIERLTGLRQVRVIVVDNNSPDHSLEAIADLPVTQIQRDENGGFARGTNEGWRAGSAPYVLILNPDAEITEASLDVLVARLERDSSLGAVAPRVVSRDGEEHHSLRRFPRLRSTYAQALFLHRLFPSASWVDEVVRDPSAYAAPFHPEWFSGACILVRREALELIGGLDERFFLYCEDIDLCHRLRDHGFELLYDPASTCIHEGGASGDRSVLLRILAESRVRYAYKYYSRPAAMLERAGVALGAITHAAVSRGGGRRRRGHLSALLAALLTSRF
jgi:GT2 family glycosyltransferase